MPGNTLKTSIDKLIAEIFGYKDGEKIGHVILGHLALEQKLKEYLTIAHPRLVDI